VTRRATNEVARRPASRTALHPRAVAAPGAPDVDLGPLTREQLRSIERSLRDLDDPTRYFLVSDFGAGFKLYYEISDGVYVMNEPARATLFKTRATAQAVRATLGRGIKLVRCLTKMKGGKRVPLVTQGKARPTKRGGTRSRRTRG
jgi:hypothetical protein